MKIKKQHNKHSVTKRLNLLNRKQCLDFYLIINEKLKDLQNANKGEIKKSDGLEYEEVQTMFASPVLIYEFHRNY
ncbi:1861_t:CDS:2 [Funneliformis geosporum]|uniref:16005_t:CDS:1 n=1 Tax=Funneliformis geosporum TaxID=1117311 RepID=A0A9W4SMR9_9GLOM|nr:1861_t:CDS:2 [Funneliformis geosporum]CAI2175857.1 16005_t:CDS:2 [Funneliformis geosporum]